METDLLYYKIGIGLVPKIGPILTKRLVAYCGSIDGVFREKFNTLAKIPGIGDKLANSIIKHRASDRIDKEIEYINKNDVTPLFYLDEDYPGRLKHCEDAPIMLYVKGKTYLNRSKIISIVGTRYPSDYGRKFTKELINNMAANYTDVLIVSGLAYGIDICAHKAALDNNLHTVAVLGHGFNTVYPSLHHSIAQKITQNGALITEFMHDDPPESPNFVKRNRIIAGLSDATLVVESGEHGGALITADIAWSYNRDVFAVPGRVFDKQSKGCNNIIKINKAALIENLNDIEYILAWKRQEKKPEAFQKMLFPELGKEEEIIFSLIKTGKQLSIDELAVLSKLPVSKTSVYLLDLEFKGLVKCLPGKIYALANN